MADSQSERIHVYAMCFNEERMLPFFLLHYREWVDRIFIFDNGSTDRSLDLLAGESKVSIRKFETTGHSFVEAARKLLDNVWKESRGSADWVIIAEVDEHLYHADLPAYLASCRSSGVTALQTIGYEMVADDFPSGSEPLFQQVNRGIRFSHLDKLAIFRPDQIIATNYGVGRHAARPEGNVVFDSEPQVCLLHFKAMGIDYKCSRNSTLGPRLRGGDREQRWGYHWLVSRDNVETTHRNMGWQARRVPGLARTHDLDLTFGEEKRLILDSGLFDESFYANANADVVAAGVDLCRHFCLYGSREHRAPHRHFDIKWYLSRYLNAIRADVNPLVDYLVRGEALGRCPNPYFDPEMYRMRASLPSQVSPLRHWLESAAAN